MERQNLFTSGNISLFFLLLLFFFCLLSSYELIYVTGCNVYTYGSDCKKCGNCSGGVQCNHMTGTCPNGCDAGIYGDKCDLGNVEIKCSFNKTNSAFNVKLCCFSKNCIFLNEITKDTLTRTYA